MQMSEARLTPGQARFGRCDNTEAIAQETARWTLRRTDTVCASPIPAAAQAPGAMTIVRRLMRAPNTAEVTTAERAGGGSSQRIEV